MTAADEDLVVPGTQEGDTQLWDTPVYRVRLMVWHTPTKVMIYTDKRGRPGG